LGFVSHWLSLTAETVIPPRRLAQINLSCIDVPLNTNQPTNLLERNAERFIPSKYLEVKALPALDIMCICSNCNTLLVSQNNL
jgi:hypothetical protein